MRTCRTWCLTITYGFCFGIELTMNNIIVQYLFDQFGVSLTIAGLLGSLFGLMNICARSIGGLGSDMMGVPPCFFSCNAPDYSTLLLDGV